jgi:hypothetical protein
VGPTPIEVVCAPMFDAGSSELKAISGNGFQRILGADAVATERFGQSQAASPGPQIHGTNAGAGSLSRSYRNQFAQRE